jgi:hypothetical protein
MLSAFPDGCRRFQEYVFEPANPAHGAGLVGTVPRLSLIWDASSGTLYLGRLIWDALPGTLYLGRFTWDASPGTLFPQSNVCS